MKDSIGKKVYGQNGQRNDRTKASMIGSNFPHSESSDLKMLTMFNYFIQICRF